VCQGLRFYQRFTIWKPFCLEKGLTERENCGTISLYNSRTAHERANLCESVGRKAMGLRPRLGYGCQAAEGRVIITRGLAIEQAFLFESNT